MSNNISFLGTIGKDPELRQVGEHKVLQFSLANNIGWGDKKKTLWWSCGLWNKRADAMQSILKKGMQVYVTGEVDTREYEGKNGKGFSLELKIMDLDLVNRSDDGEGSSQAPQSPAATPETDTDMPF